MHNLKESPSVWRRAVRATLAQLLDRRRKLRDWRAKINLAIAHTQDQIDQLQRKDLAR